VAGWELLLNATSGGSAMAVAAATELITSFGWPAGALIDSGDISGTEMLLALRLRLMGSQARPIYHRKRDSIEAHLTIVFAALAVSRWIEH
jgi:hypothetical protein